MMRMRGFFWGGFSSPLAFTDGNMCHQPSPRPNNVNWNDPYGSEEDMHIFGSPRCDSPPQLHATARLQSRCRMTALSLRI